MTALAILGMVLTIVGATLLYAGAPHQQLTSAGRQPALIVAGALATLLGLPPLLTFFGPAAAVFVWLTLAMLVWSVVPIAVAWRRGPREKAR